MEREDLRDDNDDYGGNNNDLLLHELCIRMTNHYKMKSEIIHKLMWRKIL
jgi:hypothetical protein